MEQYGNGLLFLRVHVNHSKLIVRYSFLLFLIFLLPAWLAAQQESWFVREVAVHLGGQTEISVENGRIDIVTQTHAIEVERAEDWKHAIGQSLWYALQKNLEAGIVLIVMNDKDWNMGMRLNSTLQHAGLAEKIKVWYYPHDFGLTPEEVQQKVARERNDDPNATDYWLSTNSGIRHNKTCTWYTNSKGRYCNASEGQPCKKCGG